MNNKTELIRIAGNEFTLLINYFLENFPENSSLSINRKSKQAQIKRILMKCSIFIILLVRLRKLNTYKYF